jgi:hypothetical protein
MPAVNDIRSRFEDTVRRVGDVTRGFGDGPIQIFVCEA